jgi:ubiquinone/menaquinone biosynthesis C-methylase UbiE
MNEEKKDSIYQRFAGKGVFPYQLAFTLLIPLRSMFLSARTLIQRLELKDHLTVLEIGPGPGYFSVSVARALTQGELFLYDIQQQMLDYAKQRMTKRKLTNVSYHLATGRSFPFEDKKFDRVFMVTVFGEVEQKDLYVQEIRRILKEDGIVSLSELVGDPDRLTKEEIKRLFVGHGFIFHDLYETRWSCTINFRKCSENPENPQNVSQ